MAKRIDITQQHSLGKAEAKDRVQAATKGLAKTYGLQKDWNQNVCTFSGPGVSGTITVRNNNVQFECDLADQYDAVAPTVEERVRTEMKTALA